MDKLKDIMYPIRGRKEGLILSIINKWQPTLGFIIVSDSKQGALTIRAELLNKFGIKINNNKMKKMLKVKPFQETLNAGMCGPASLKIVLDYYGVVKEEKELAKMCGTKKDLGTDDQGLKTAAEKLGFKVKIKDNSNFRDIEKWLDKGVPVIVNWFTRGRTDYMDADVSDGHYSVVCGLDDKNIYLQDPETGKMRKLDKEDFMTVWFDFAGRCIKPNELIIRQIIAIYR